MFFLKNPPPWLSEVAADLQLHFPKLLLVVEKSGIFVYGDFDVVADGVLIDTFKLRILLPRDYPEEVPRVWETGGKLQKSAARHFNQSDYSACLFVEDERWKQWPSGASFSDFLKRPVHLFFLGQAYYDLKGEWLFGERGHGDKGVLEYYREELALSNYEAVSNCLNSIIGQPVKDSSSCPCGSGAKTRNCHGKVLRSLQSGVPVHLLVRARHLAMRASRPPTT